MNNKMNMAFAALLCAGIIALLCGFISKNAVKPEELAKDAVAVEAAAGGGGAAGAKAGPEPVLAMLATADVERGKTVAKACAACHSFDKGGANGVGPNLWGVVGAKKMAHAGFAYSGALTSQGGDTWTYTEISHFLWKPKAYAKDTKMNFIGVKKPEDRAAVIAYLRTLADAPKPLPSEAEIAAEAPKDAAAAPATAPAADAAATPAADAKAEAAPKAEAASAEKK